MVSSKHVICNNNNLIKFTHLGNSSKLDGTHSWPDYYTSCLRKSIVSTRHHNEGKLEFTVFLIELSFIWYFGDLNLNVQYRGII